MRGGKLSLALLSPNMRHFGIIGKGFQPGEPVTTTSISDTEVLKNEIPALSDGLIAAIVDPGVIGKTGGQASFQASSKSCDVTLHYAWGSAMKQIDE